MVTRQKSVITDDAHLAALGVKQELKRNFSPLSMLGLAFAILNSWTALSTSMSLALPSGGPTSVIWGLVTAGFFNLCLAASLAEFLMTTSSRMTYAFARDGGLPFSRYLARVHKSLDVPLEALGLTTAVVTIFGLIFLGSTSAFNAIVSASVVALGVSYGIPITISCLRGRKQLPPTRTFVLPEWLGWTVNLMGIAFVLVTTVLFVFPPELPVAGSNMNYCIVAFAVVFIISVVQWFVDGAKNYSGPKPDLTLVAMDTSDSVPEHDALGSSTLKDKRLSV